MPAIRFRCFIASLLGTLLLLSSIGAHAAGRSPVRGKNGMVASSSTLASEVGLEALRSGGNAIDAAVATAFALAVTWPTAGNIGGGGFLIYHGADGETAAFDFREKAPLAATDDMYLDDEGNIREMSNHIGILAVGVPGTVAGLEMAHEKYGTLEWAELVEPAIQLARNGIPITWKLHDDFNSNRRLFVRYPSSMKIFFRPDGSSYEPGDNWLQPDLARSLERIQRNGADGFYKGETAQLIADFMASNGGIITKKDLENYRAVEREPIIGNYRGYDVVSMPPPSSGGVILVQMLNILEGFDLKTIGHNSGMYLHLLTETMRRAYADRANYLGDPDFNEDMPLARLMSKEYAERLRSSIDPEFKSESDPVAFADRYESEDTTHFSVVDKDGNMVALTYTLEWGYGSHIVVEGGGFLLNNEMGDFNAQPGVAIDGVPLFATGTPGGKTIINTTMQTILNVIDHEMSIAKALEAPRIHHQWLPDVSRFESWGISPDSRRLYEERGHKISEVTSIGSAMGVYRDPETGILYGAADSRAADGGVAAW